MPKAGAKRGRGAQAGKGTVTRSAKRKEGEDAGPSTQAQAEAQPGEENDDVLLISNDVNFDTEVSEDNEEANEEEEYEDFRTNPPLSLIHI